MTETEQPKKSKQRFRDLIEGADELEKDKDLIKSQMDSFGISAEGETMQGSGKGSSENALPKKGGIEEDTGADPGAEPTKRKSSSPGSESSALDPSFDETEVLGESTEGSRSPLDDTPPPPLGSTPHTPPPALDARGMPLPRRMDEAPVRGKTSPASIKRSRTVALPPDNTSKLMSWWKKAGPGGWNRGEGWGCILKMLVMALFTGIVLALIAGSFAIIHYNRIAATLPTVEDLREQAAKFETTRILDREGNVLYELLDPTAGRRTYVPLDEISPYLVAATIATEDSNFYSHPGYDVLAIARSFWYNS
jgi:hypothetical protein